MARVVPLSAFLKVEFPVAFKRVDGDVFAGCNIVRLGYLKSVEAISSYFWIKNKETIPICWVRLLFHTRS